MNAPERPEYASALEALEPILYDLPPVIIAIDGRAGTGKTTLGRFLSWRFNVSLLETDLFLIKGQNAFIYRNAAIKKVILSRINSCRPIIVEGVVSLSLLKKLNFDTAFHVRVECNDSDCSPWMNELWDIYASEFTSKISASLTLDLPVNT